MTEEITVIINPDRRRLAMRVLRSRLKLEIRFPGRVRAVGTLQAAKAWGFPGRTRRQALAWVESQIAGEEGDHGTA